MDSADDLDNLLDRLLVELGDERELTLPADRGASVGTWARSFALFRSAVALHDSQEPGALGLIVRALYEEYLVAILLASGTDDDLRRLRADFAHWSAEHSTSWQMPHLNPPGDEPKRTWGVRARAVRVDQLEPTAGAVTMYPLIYGGESFAGAHAGYATSLRYRRGVGSQSEEVSHEADHIGAHERVAMCANITSVTWELAQLDRSEIVAIATDLDRWLSGR